MAEDSLYKRNIEGRLLEALSDTPVVLVQGARQVGKSTLLAMISDGLDCRQLTLDDPNTLLAARNDPVDFVSQYPTGTLVIDELQLCPQLLRAIKLSVDKGRRAGRFLLTGSADLLHVAGANESLAGRVEILDLHPLSQGEFGGVQEDFVAEALNEGLPARLGRFHGLARGDYAGLVATGGYPAASRRTATRRAAYYKNYLAGVLDHDAVALSNLSHLDMLSKLFAVLNADTAKIFVQANVSRAVGIPETSLNGYIRLLHDLHLLHALPAWGRNVAKRAASKPKLFVADTGLACAVTGVRGEYLSSLQGGELFGALLETFAANELLKQRTWSAQDFQLFHFHDRENREVDIVVALPDGRIVALEVKAARTVYGHDFAGLRYLRDLIGAQFVGGVVLYTGDQTQQYDDRLFFAPLSTLWAGASR